MHVFHCTANDVYRDRIVRAQGCYLEDGAGQRFLDLEAGVWCLALGHNHPAVNQALQDQLQTVCHSGYRYSHPLVEEAAARLTRLAGLPEGQAVFLSSGSEAVELAVKAARSLRPGKKLLYLEDFFLSSYGEAATRPPAGWLGIHHKTELDSLPWAEIGGFLLEPGNASGLVHPPKAEFLAAVVQRLRAADGLLLLDEVTTGIGRSGRWFGFEHYGLEPDLLACGKGLGNGYPVSALVLSAACAAQLLAGGFRYAQSHQNDPLGCAVAATVLRVLEEEGWIEHAASVGAYFLQALNRLAAQQPKIAEARGRGLLLALELHPEVDITSLHSQLLERGYFTGLHAAQRTLRFYPPLILEKGMVDEVVAVLAELLAD